jgi:hypothetical protein
MTNIEVEKWLPVAGWERWYEVSDLGRARSLSRMVTIRGRAARMQGRVLVLSVDPAGRRTAGFSRACRQHRYKVATLVLEAFVGFRPPGAFVRFADADYSNCRLTNLSWSTVSRCGQHDSRALNSRI